MGGFTVKVDVPACLPILSVADAAMAGDVEVMVS
jgi:hypothetical protein